jgi:hypothetical protein
VLISIPGNLFPGRLPVLYHNFVHLPKQLQVLGIEQVDAGDFVGDSGSITLARKFLTESI